MPMLAGEIPVRGTFAVFLLPFETGVSLRTALHFMSTGAIAYPPTTHLEKAVSYPYWDESNRYMVYPKIPFAVMQEHPSGWWQVRCYGNKQECPSRLGPYLALTDAKAAMEAHCLSAHYIQPPI